LENALYFNLSQDWQSDPGIGGNEHLHVLLKFILGGDKDASTGFLLQMHGDEEEGGHADKRNGKEQPA
jgi:hypothetical protein